MNRLHNAESLIRRATERLPRSVRAAEDFETGLSVYEIVLAYNLDFPLRWTQAYLWLDVLAATPERAMAAARNVVLADEQFEETGLYRIGGPHRRQAGRIPQLGNAPISVRWDLPIVEGKKPGSVIRDPVYGLRVGFLSDQRTAAMYLSDVERREFAVVVRKPVPRADPVCLCPWVRRV